MPLKDRLYLIALLLVGGAALYFGLVHPRASRVPPRILEAVADLKPAIPPLAPPPLVVPEIPAVPLPPLLPIAAEKKP